ncbi:MAG TPA: hypothetical protein VGF99_05210, partial [Myxococcota bacterium]
MHDRLLRLLLVCATAVTSLAMGCITPTVRRNELRSLEKVALISVHARRTMGMQDAAIGPMFALNTVGEEVIDISLPTIEGEVEGLFGEGRVVPPAVAMTSKKYDLVPEALPPEDWSQAQKMLAVDIDDPRTPAALGALARDLAVSAVVVIRHEFSMSRDTYNRSFTLWASDWCTVLVVDLNGVVLWRESSSAREPVQMMWRGPFTMMNSQFVQIEAARNMARQLARQSWHDLIRSFKAIPAGAPVVPAANQPPAPLAP